MRLEGSVCRPAVGAFPGRTAFHRVRGARPAARLLLAAILLAAAAAPLRADGPPCAPPGYWQQSVRHEIRVRLDTEKSDLVGHMVLEYRNNSPDTLLALYFHLFQNAFRKGSHMDDLRRARGDLGLAKLKPDQEGGTTVDNVRDATGHPLGVRVDDTIMEVTLLEPLLPGDSVTVEMDFTTHYGKVRGRAKRLDGLDRKRKTEDRQFQAAQWYPRIAVYDRRRGWNIDQHVGREFYGEFGAYDVEITAPGRHIVAATGILQNAAEVMPPDRREALDLRHYAEDIPPSSRPPVPDPPDTVLTWRYHARDVHDFAWVADPTFRIGETEWDGIKVYAYAREKNAPRWQDAHTVCARFLEFFCERVGRYVWPQHSVIDASSGMEYPMLSMDGQKSPQYYSLIGHELAHNWFMGMVASNETYAAFLDEGFTNFITAWASDSLWSPESSGTFYDEAGWYRRTFYPRASLNYIRNIRLHLSYTQSGYMDPLYLHSDRFGEYRSYRQVYFKTARMLDALRLVLGNEVFERAFSQYVACWKLRHPYPEDFITVMENVSGRPLDWFFDQWFHTTGTVDYAIESVGGRWVETPGQRRYEAEITLRRKGEVFMPLDLDLVLAEGSVVRAHIPVDRHAKTEGRRRILPAWSGWGPIRETYTARVALPSKPAEVRIDGDGRLPDADGRDNVWRGSLLHRLQPFGPMRLKWDNVQLHYESPDAYDVLWRPSVGYNDPDGLWIGAHLRGSYLDQEWTRFDQLELTPRLGLKSGRLRYELTYDTPVNWLGRLTRWHLKSAVVDGRSWQEIGLEKRIRDRMTEGPEGRIGMALRSRQVMDPEDLAPALLWNGEVNNSVLLSYDFTTWWPLKPRGHLLLETTLGGTTPQATRLEGGIRATATVGKLQIVPRAFAGYVTRTRAGGAAVPPADTDLDPWLYDPARGTTMDLFEEPFYRVNGALPDEWWRDGRVIHPRGPFLRSFGDVGPAGNRIWTASLDVKLRGFVEKWMKKAGVGAGVLKWLHLDLSAYYEMGNLKLRTDDDFLFPPDPMQGLGLTWRWRAPVRIPGLRQETLWIHVPFWTDDPNGLRSSDDGWDLRWAVGIGGWEPEPIRIR